MRSIPRPLRLAALLGALTLVLACNSTEEKQDYVDKMAKEHSGETPEKAAAGTSLGEEPKAELDTAEVVYATIDGKEIKGYLAKPKGATGALPSILVIHEWWGLNDNVKLMARHLAASGYQALAIDLYQGASATTADEAKGLMSRAMENPDAGVDNIKQAHAFLKDKQNAGKIGTIGWCFGGGWSLRSAMALGDGVQATVIYYGHLVSDPAELAPIKAPMLGIFGAEDKGIPVADVEAFRKAVGEAGKTATIEIFPGADHAFANPSGARYKADAAEKAWAMTLEFFSKHLGG